MLVVAAVTSAFLVLTFSFASYWGGRPERWGATIVALMALLQLSGLMFQRQIYYHVDPVSVVIDAFALTNFGVLALRANRVWPIWATSLQILSLSAHFARAVDLANPPLIYGMMKSLPSFCLLLALILGTANHQRLLRRDGRDPDWN